MCTCLLVNFKESLGKIFFLSFFTFVTSIFNGTRRSFAAGSPGAVCSDPFGILRQVLLHHPGVSDKWGRKKLPKSDHGAMKATKVDLVQHLLLSWRALKKLGGKFSFCLFLHLLHLYLTALDAALLRGRRGRCARIPSGSCARFYYNTRGFLMSGGEKIREI